MDESSKPKHQSKAPGGFVSLGTLRGTPPADPVAEIKRIYYHTGRKTITQDLAEAIELLKQLPTEEERQRAAVYMDGLAEMRSDWERQARRGGTDRQEHRAPGTAKRKP